MKTIILLLLLSLTAHAQWDFGFGRTGGGGSGSSRFSAVDLDGSTEYMYRDYAVADSFLNLNGYERFQNANSTGFESTIGTWLNKGNHAIDTVTANKIFGNKSGQIISSGAGDSLANFVCLVPSATSYHGVTAGDKYTMELWHKALFVSPGDSLIIYHGGKRKAFLASTTAGKAVYNYEVNSFTVARDTIKVYTNNAGGDTILIDSVNFSQAFDAVIEGWVYPRSTGDGIAAKGAYSSASKNWTLTQTSGTSYEFFVSDEVTLTDGIGTRGKSITGTLLPNQWNYIHLRYSRGASGTLDSLRLYTNGVLSQSVVGFHIGNFNNTRRLEIGARSGFGVAPFDGSIGEFRITRFSNIGSSTWTTATPLTTYNAYTRGAGFSDAITGGGKKISLWLDWSVYDTDANFLMDLSGNGYNLTGNAVTTADHTFWKR